MGALLRLAKAQAPQIMHCTFIEAPESFVSGEVR